jgi:hypothetical protein
MRDDIKDEESKMDMNEHETTETSEMVEILSDYLNAEVCVNPSGGYLWRTSQSGDYGWQPVTDEQIDAAVREVVG